MEFINQNFKIVYQPYDKSQYNNRRRFAIGGKSISDYVGEHNAKKLLIKAFKNKGKKLRVKLRKHGIIDFYNK